MNTNGSDDKQRSTLQVSTTRLRLIPSSAAVARAELHDRTGFEELISARVPAAGHRLPSRTLSRGSSRATNRLRVTPVG